MTIKQQSVAAAAAHILSAPSMFWALGDISEQNIKAKILEAEEKAHRFSDGEKIIVKLAAAIYTEQAVKDVGLVLTMLAIDDDQLKRVIEAMIALRPDADPRA